MAARNFHCLEISGSSESQRPSCVAETTSANTSPGQKASYFLFSFLNRQDSWEKMQSSFKWNFLSHPLHNAPENKILNAKIVQRFTWREHKLNQHTETKALPLCLRNTELTPPDEMCFLPFVLVWSGNGARFPEDPFVASSSCKSTTLSTSTFRLRRYVISSWTTRITATTRTFQKAALLARHDNWCGVRKQG